MSLSYLKVEPEIHDINSNYIYFVMGTMLATVNVMSMSDGTHFMIFV